MMNPRVSLAAVHRPSPMRCRRAFTLVELVIVIGLILLLVAITVTVSVGVIRQSEVRETQNVITILDNALEEWLLQEGRPISYGRGVTHPGVDDFGEPCGTVQRPLTYQIPQLSEAGTIWTDPNDDTPAPGLTAARTAQWETDFLIATMLRRPGFEAMISSINPRFMQRLQVVDPPANQNVDLTHLDSEETDFLDFTPPYIYRFGDAWGRVILAIQPGRAFDRQCFDDDEYCIGAGEQERCADDDGTIRTPLENVFGVAESRRIFFVSSGPSERFGMLHLHLPEGQLSSDQQREVDRAADNIYSYEVETDRARPQ